MSAIRGTTKVFALLGSPVSHSRSPDIHNPLFVEHGIDARYVCIPVPADRSDRIADALRTFGLAGCNLTVPHKTAILSQLDQLDDAARAAGAVNTVVRQQDGSLHGYNTDADGLRLSLEQGWSRSVQGGTALVIGAGGAGRAVASGLLRGGAARVVLFNRTLSRAEAVATALAEHFEADRLAVAGLTPSDFARHAEGAAVVVNCTGGDAAPIVSALPLAGLPQDAAWVDINYWMAEPPGLAECRDRGLFTQDGLPMLAWQGALAFEHFTGRAVDPVPLLVRLR